MVRSFKPAGLSGVPRFDAVLAVELLEHAQAVYRYPDQLTSWVVGKGFDGACIIPRRSTQVGITYSPDTIVIAARGSSQWGDWGENLLALKCRYRALFPEGRVHLGFRTQAGRIAQEFRDLMEVLRGKYPNAKVYVTGHSLGGALCAFLVRLCAIDGIPVEAVYTFESPRIGDQDFALWYDATYGCRTFRVVAIRRGCTDLVTRLPLSGFGWRHIGRPTMIVDGQIYESNALWEKARARHPVRPLPWWRVASRLKASIGAHLCDSLLSELRAVAAVTRGGRS
jgi:hypothetical protein